MRIVFPQDGGIYQQDIAECHTADSVRSWFKEHQDQFIVLPCPENSPDLSPINNLWNPLDRVVRVMDLHAGSNFWEDIVSAPPRARADGKQKEEVGKEKVGNGPRGVFPNGRLGSLGWKQTITGTGSIVPDSLAEQS
ncbi:transposable element Tcb1 transposase [Trichonephila clavipes]|nr:transposable element Tcb1 transposase [Trichonephila clavipes]